MFSNEEYSFLNHLVLRTPFYSVDAYSPERLPEVLDQQAFRNAILLASPGLYRSIEKKGFRYEALGEKERLTLFKYYNRMSFRPTPFGAFAAVSLAGWSAKDQIRLAPPASAVLTLLPSLEATIHTGANEPVKETMVFVNPTAYRFGNSWRYIRSSATVSGKLEFSLQSVTAAPLLDHLFSLAGSRAVSFDHLTREIMLSTRCSDKEAEGYAAFLVKEQVLLTDQLPGLIEPASSDGRITILSDQQVPETEISFPPQEHSMRPMAPYYTGMQRATESGGVGPEIQERLRAVLQVLAQIVPHRPIQALEDFKKAFKSRFDLQKIPLLTALDPDGGISYENLHTEHTGELLPEGLTLRDVGAKEEIVKWNAVNRMFLKIWLQDTKRGLHDPVNIKDADLEALPADLSTGTPAASLAVLFTRSDGQLVMESAGGATAAALVGRFSAFDPETSLLAREISRAEISKNPDILFAEIHQRSNNHVDNINRRVQLYDHIIPINVFPHAHETGHILPNDLLISVRNDEVLLESVSLGKRIIPRLPTAYNYQHNELALFRFLCDLQYQGLQSNLSFDPERLFPGLSFYPRFCYRDCILSLARWIFDQEQIAPLLVIPCSIGRLHLFRQEHGVPRHISLTQGDQQLVFDLAGDRDAYFFLENIRLLKIIVLREYLFPDGSLTTGKNKRHSGQYLALLKKERPVYQGSKPKDLPDPKFTRHFLPGSEWLYLGVYCTEISADKVLQQIVLPVVASAGANVSGWFFIRYHDPRPHLRIRIRVSPEQTGNLLSAFNRQLRGDCGNLISDYKLEAYCRELERYSTDLIGSVEDLFCAGSLIYMDLLNENRKRPGNALWPFVFVYTVINRFLAGRSTAVTYLLWVKDNFLEEFKADKQLRRELDEQYRQISGDIGILLHDNAGTQLTATYSVQQYLLKIDMLSAANDNRTIADQERLLCDLVHMEVNRLFLSDQRQHEAVIYYCLYKYESSRIAREKAGRKTTAGD